MNDHKALHLLKTLLWVSHAQLARVGWRLNARKIFSGKPERLAGPSKDYQKFIILAQPRTGSNMLADVLRKHPEIVCYGEIFHPKGIEFGRPGLPGTKALARRPLTYLRRKWPGRFLSEFIYGSYAADVRAVGFKVFPWQVSEGEFTPALRWLETEPGVAIIALSRENSLQRYVSHTIAHKTNRWLAVKSDVETAALVQNTRVAVNPAEIEKIHAEHAAQMAALRQRFRNHPWLEVTYEQLVAEGPGAQARIFDFLGVEPKAIASSLVKQETRKMSEVVTNYEELVSTWRGTPWEKFLEQ